MSVTIGDGVSLVEIADLTADATPTNTNEVVSQETGGGSLVKSTIAQIANVGSADSVTLADTTDATSFPVVAGAATGNEALLTDASNLTYNATSGELTAAGFIGALDGALGGTTPAAATVTTFTSTGIDDNSTETAITISSNEEVTMALQPCFLARPSTTLSNVTGNGTLYTVVFATETTDQGGDFDGTSTFTAPISGNYLLTACVSVSGITAAADEFSVRLVTSNRMYELPRYHSNGLAGGDTRSVVVVADMDAADTATVAVFVSGEASDVVDISSGSYFSGWLLG